MHLFKALRRSYETCKTPGVIYKGVPYYHNPYKTKDGRLDFRADVGSFDEHTLMFHPDFQDEIFENIWFNIRDCDDYTPIEDIEDGNS